MNFSYLAKGISQLMDSPLGEETNVIIKDFHDESLNHLLEGKGELVMEGLTSNQIWYQLNQHLQKAITKWEKYVNRTDVTIEEELNKMEDEPERGQEVGEQEMVQMVEEGHVEEDQEEEHEEEEKEKSEESDKMLDMEDEDVGLYGELLDDENEEKYDNEEPEEGEEDFKIPGMLRGEDNEEQDEVEDENFEHFREIGMENEAGENTEKPSKEKSKIEQLEDKILYRQDWRWQGEVSSKQRPLNSLVENPLEFKRGLKFEQQGDENENTELEDKIKRRVLDEVFDDRVRIEVMPGFREHFTNLPEVSTQKNKQSLGEIYEADFANSLGLKSTKEDREKKEIMDLFKELNYKLDRLSNFSFIPKPVVESKVPNEAYILREEHVPITASEGKTSEAPQGRIALKSEKEEGSTRLKTKKIMRQRRKQQESKRMKRSIEYGGMSKVQLQAKKKIQKSKRQKTTKYSQSGQFFKKFQDNISSKEKSKANPNLNKLKI